MSLCATCQERTLKELEGAIGGSEDTVRQARARMPELRALIEKRDEVRHAYQQHTQSHLAAMEAAKQSLDMLVKNFGAEVDETDEELREIETKQASSIIDMQVCHLPAISLFHPLPCLSLPFYASLEHHYQAGAISPRPSLHGLLSPSLTFSHRLSPSLTFSHRLSPSLTFSHRLYGAHHDRAGPARCDPGAGRGDRGGDYECGEIARLGQGDVGGAEGDGSP